MKKHTVQVRQYHNGGSHYSSDSFTVVETIQRKLWGEAIGNFNPIFCRYKGKRTLVQSDEGDLSDPFRRTREYAKTLFIETK